MKKFLAIYLGTEAALEKSGWNQLNEEQRKARQAEGIQAWIAWGKANAAAIVDQGTPLGKTKLASASGTSNTKNDLTGYVIVQAESHDAAVKLFENHPHFTIFPGESVEVMECLPMPQ
jgi:transcription antitermination factor NusG